MLIPEPIVNIIGLIGTACFVLFGVCMWKPKWALFWTSQTGSVKGRLLGAAVYGAPAMLLIGLAANLETSPDERRWIRHEDQILTQMAADLEAGHYQSVIDTSQRYLSIEELSSKDSAMLLKLHDQAVKDTLAAFEDSLTIALRSIPAENTEANLNAYQKLVAIDSANAEYRERRDYYQTQFEREQEAAAARERAAAERERARRARQEKIEDQFSAWDGANYPVEEAVKQRLKDPDSYEHIETRYSDEGDHLYVVMRFRARNSFGGYVVNTAYADVTLEGQVISLSVE